jgi:hypothetical protein
LLRVPTLGFKSAGPHRGFELHDVEYPRDGKYVASQGLYVRLDPFGAQWFNISPV